MKIKIFDNIKLKINSNLTQKAFLANIFEYYRTDFSENEDILIEQLDSPGHKSDSKFTQSVCNIIDNFIVIKDYNNKFCFVDINEKTFRIKIEKGFSADFFVFNILEPLFVIWGFLHGTKCLFPFHSSCFNIHNQPTMIVSQSGLGKTSILLNNILSNKNEYISDEITFIDKNAEVFPYLRRIYLYKRNFKAFPVLYKKINAGYSLKFKHITSTIVTDFLKYFNKNKIAIRLHTKLEKVKFMFPILVSPDKLGKVSNNKHMKLKNIFILINNDEEIKKGFEQLLFESFIDLWLERYMFYLGLQIIDVNNNSRILYDIFSNYRNNIRNIQSKVKIAIINSSRFKNITQLNDHINEKTLNN